MSFMSLILGKAEQIHARNQRFLAQREARRLAELRLEQIVEATANSQAIRQYRACREAALIVKGRNERHTVLGRAHQDAGSPASQGGCVQARRQVSHSRILGILLASRMASSPALKVR